jgi:hypothetical protein
MNIRHLALAAAIIAAVSPAAGHAASDQAPITACAKAFAESIGVPGAAAAAYKVAFQPASSGSILAAFYATEYSFTLEARSPASGQTFARATCSTNRAGQVTAISTTRTNVPAAAGSDIR